MKKTIMLTAAFITLLTLIACNKGGDRAVTGREDNITGTEGIADTEADKDSDNTGTDNITPAGDQNNQSDGRNAGITPTNIPDQEIDFYELSRDTYSVGEDIVISYPVVTGLGDDDRQTQINDLIKKDALSFLPISEKEEGELTGLSMEIEYEIKWKGSRVLSIQYDGMEYYEGAAHPNNIFITTNIDMNTGSRIQLQDVCYIDQLLIEEIIDNNVYVWPLGSEDAEINTMMQEEITDYLMLSELYGNSFYFTQDSIGISKYVSHAAGDYAVYEVKYQDILRSIKADSDLWRGFIGISADIKAGNDGSTPNHIINISDLKQFNINEDQSFQTELENWGKVRFVSGTDFRGKLVFLLTDADNSILLQFPDFIGGYWNDQNVGAVAFRDLNGDGLKDVIVISTDPMSGYTSCDVYFQMGMEFIQIQEISEGLNYADRKYTTVSEIEDYMKTTGKTIADKYLNGRAD